MRARAAGLEPDLVLTQHVAIGVRMRHLADVVERVDEPLELLCEFTKHSGERPAARAASAAVGQRAVSAAAHRNVVIDIDEAAREALREKASDEQRDIAEPLQGSRTFLGRACVGRLGEHQRERPQTRAGGGRLEQRLAAGEHREQVHDVMLGVLLDGDVLTVQRFVDGIAKELAQIAHVDADG